MSCCSFSRAKVYLGSPTRREHESEEFLRQIERELTLGEEARPCLTDRDRRFNILGHRASCSGFALARGSRWQMPNLIRSAVLSNYVEVLEPSSLFIRNRGSGRKPS